MDTHGGATPCGVLILVVLDLDAGDVMVVVSVVVGGVVGGVVVVVMDVVTTGVVTAGTGGLVGPSDVFSRLVAPYAIFALRFRLVHMDDTMFCLLDGGGGATAAGGGGGGGIVLAVWEFVVAAMGDGAMVVESKAMARLYNA